jgi:hypothetical protein
MVFLGCTSQYGHFVPNSQFAYANSNVRTLGPVKAEITKSAWFSAPELTIDDIRGVYNKALTQAEGANIMINYKEDTYYTIMPLIPFSSVTYRIEGEAAKMEVGKQELR